MTVPKLGSQTRVASVVAGALVLAYLLFHVVRVTRSLGYWGYSIDDAYIHLAIANSLRNYGVWGLTRFDAAGASSSPLWTILLATFGAPYWLPIVLNIVLAGGSTAWLAAECTRRSRSTLVGIALALLAALLTLVVFAVSSGMEHVFHGVLGVLFLRACFKAQTSGGTSGGTDAQSEISRISLIAVWGLLAVACRIESVLILAVGFLLLIAGRKGRPALMVVLGGLAGLSVYALIGAWQHMPAIPNSVAMKVLETNGTGLLGRFSSNLDGQTGLVGIAWVLGICLLATVVSIVRQRSLTPTKSALLVATTIPLLHILVAKISYVGRYEVYILMVAFAFGFPGLAASLDRDHPSRLRNFIGAGVVALILLVTRLSFPRAILVSEGIALRWSRETDSSQREIARFIQHAAPTGTVLLNDVGAPSLFTRARILDLWGLGNNEVCRERLRVGGVVPPDWIEGFAQREKADLALVFESWFDGRTFPNFRSPGKGMPASWTKVGEFRFNDPPSTILGAPVVSVYVVRPGDAAALRAKFASYRPVSPLNTPVPQ